jgi:glycosyltransferase involved in cell wall biosynthesis
MSALLDSMPWTGTPSQPSALRRLWRYLPQHTRNQLQSNLTRLIAPAPDPDARGGFPIGIAGMFSTASGIGEGARLAYTSLDASGYAPSAFDLSGAFGQVEFSTESHRRSLTPGGGSLIIHANGPFIPHALLALGTQRVRGRRIIGYWAWELPRLTPIWQPAFRFVHEVWVPSRFTRDAVAAATDLPVHVVPHPLPPMPVTPNMRLKLGLPQDALIVLNVFHLGSGFVRKNPMAAIAAFRRAFGDAPDRVMAIKLVDNGAHRARHELEAAISGVANIRLIEGMLPHADMAGLIDASDIVISLHRSEGFGLVLAQAMALGKPVVATGWSGNLDFMNEGNSALVSCSLVPVRDPDGAFDACDQEWAEPDIDHAADWLRRLADNADLRAKLSAAAAADIHAQLSPESVVRRIDDLVGRKSLTAQR